MTGFFVMIPVINTEGFLEGYVSRAKIKFSSQARITGSQLEDRVLAIPRYE